MKKSYKIEVDCANCANLMEEAAPQDRRRGRRDRQFYDPEDDRRVRRGRGRKAGHAGGAQGLPQGGAGLRDRAGLIRPHPQTGAESKESRP